MLTINGIGCGHLGKSILRLMTIHKAAKLKGIYGLDKIKAEEASEFIGAGTVYQSIEELPPADLYLLATTDDAILPVCEQLVAANKLAPNAIVFHCSGSHSSNDLVSAKTKGCFIASVHPSVSFGVPELAVKNFKGTFCGIEGDEQAFAILKEIFEKIGGRTFKINHEDKLIYHAALVLANNYLVTSHYYAKKLLLKAGLEEETTRELMTVLMGSALNNLRTVSEKEALTGIIRRGDINTAKAEVEALKQDPVIQQVYCALGLATIPLTNLNENIKKQFERLFEQKSD